ncbi:MAG: hypothetical protein AMJ88_15960 [Anaerolineae bacterium SM23_ 63]|nr:MAG: hypothetical protein AMJ88_15960 [Anaerolineae bacterium SM23_ 63]
MIEPIKVSSQGFFGASRLRMTTEMAPSLAKDIRCHIRDLASQLLPTQNYAKLVIRGGWKLEA